MSDTLSPADHEIAERANASLAGMAGFAPYRAPACQPSVAKPRAASPKLARENKARLAAFVSAALATAPTVEDPADYLTRSSDKLNGFIRALDCGATPRHLVGVDAWALSEARERLSAEAGRFATIAKAEAALAAADPANDDARESVRRMFRASVDALPELPCADAGSPAPRPAPVSQHSERVG